jgi:hypothetical protein
MSYLRHALFLSFDTRSVSSSSSSSDDEDDPICDLNDKIISDEENYGDEEPSDGESVVQEGDDEEGLGDEGDDDLDDFVVADDAPVVMERRAKRCRAGNPKK